MTEEYRQQFLRWYSKENTYPPVNGIKILELEEGHCKMELTIKPEHMNAVGNLHGAVYFGLADCAGSVSQLIYGQSVVTLNGSINYLKGVDSSGLGTKLTATAKQIIRTRKTAVVSVEIMHGERLVATSNITMYIIGTPADFSV